ncbi:TldD/PmbA family protein [Candidatus Micrarchaeota archaeon]|nr:TldD/PmbA family protein [Candidatus Micrarchaeota archaeon]
MEDILDRILSLCEGIDYADARFASEERTTILLKDSSVDRITSGTLAGYSVRVLKDGSWGLASSNDPSKLREVVSSAIKLAKASSKRSMGSSLAQEKVVSKRFEFKPKQDARDVTMDAKVNALKELDKEMLEKGISTASIGYSEMTREYRFHNTEGAKLYSSAPLTRFLFEAFVRGETLDVARKSLVRHAGFETEKDAHKTAAETAQSAAMMKNAGRVPSGNYDVIVDSHMGGTMSHEAVGHPCEADLILTGESVLSGKLGKKIANDCISMVDDGTLFPLSGFIPFDDEGTPSQKTQLIKDGTLVSYLHSRETAAKMNTHSTGNSRADSVYFFPIVRMTNTYFEPGDHSLEELVDLKKAVIIEGFSGGVVNPSTGEYQFAGQTGWLVENGEKTKFLKNLSIAGNVMETLKSVDALSKETGEPSAGMCGKSGQSVPVGDFSPWMRIRNARVLGS